MSSYWNSQSVYAPSELSSTLSHHHNHRGLRRANSFDNSLISRRQSTIDPYTGRSNHGFDVVDRRSRDTLGRRDAWEIERQRERQENLREWERDREIRRRMEMEAQGSNSRWRVGKGGERWRLSAGDDGSRTGERWRLGKDNYQNSGFRSRDDLDLARDDLSRLSLNNRYETTHRRTVSRPTRPSPSSVVSTTTRQTIVTRTPVLSSRGLTPKSPSSALQSLPQLPRAPYSNPGSFPMSTRGTLSGYHILQILGPLVIPTRLPVVATPAEIGGLKQRFLMAMQREAAGSGGNGIVNFSIDAMGGGLFVGKGTVVVCVPEGGVFEAGGVGGRNGFGFGDRERERERLLRERERRERMMISGGGQGARERMLIGY